MLANKLILTTLYSEKVVILEIRYSYKKHVSFRKPFKGLTINKTYQAQTNSDMAKISGRTPIVFSVSLIPQQDIVLTL